MKKAFFLVLVLLQANIASAAELFGHVDAVSGEATLTDTSGGQQRVVAGLPVYAGQTVITAADSEVHLVSEDSGLIALRPGSQMRIERYQARDEETDEVALSLLKGAMRSITGWIAKKKSAAYRLHTPGATIGVRGTDHETTLVETAQDNDLPGTFDTVFEGVTVMQTASGEIEIHPGQHAYSPREAGEAPKLLSQRPGFFGRRALKMENRIHQRKETLMQHITHHSPDEVADARAKPKTLVRRNTVKQRIEQRKPRKP